MTKLNKANVEMTAAQRKLLQALHAGGVVRCIDHDDYAKPTHQYELSRVDNTRVRVNVRMWDVILRNGWVMRNGRGAGARFWLSPHGRRALGVD